MNNLREAVELTINEQMGSTSLLQRRLAIGYKQASELMDEMEKIGIVGQSRGAKPRQVMYEEISEFAYDLIEGGGDKNSLLSIIIRSHVGFGKLSKILNMKKDDVCNPEELSNMKDMIVETLMEAERFMPNDDDLVNQCEAGGHDSV